MRLLCGAKMPNDKANRRYLLNVRRLERAALYVQNVADDGCMFGDDQGLEMIAEKLRRATNRLRAKGAEHFEDLPEGLEAVVTAST